MISGRRLPLSFVSSPPPYGNLFLALPVCITQEAHYFRVSLDYFGSFQFETPAEEAKAALLPAFFGKLINFKESTRETTVALIMPF